MRKVVYMLTDIVDSYPNYTIYLNEDNIKLLKTEVTITDSVEFNSTSQEDIKHLKLQINVTNPSKINS
jgi:hypothetical protein